MSGGKTALPPGSCTMPRPNPGRRIGVGDGATVEPDDAAVGIAEPADHAEQGRLPGAVGAEQRDHLALADVEIDVEQHLHRCRS